MVASIGFSDILFGISAILATVILLSYVIDIVSDHARKYIASFTLILVAIGFLIKGEWIQAGINILIGIFLLLDAKKR